MRLIQTVAAISEEATGPAYSVVRLCESLIANGADTTLAVLDWTPMPSPPAFVKMFPLSFGPRRLGRSPSMRRWFDEEAASRPVDIIHNHGLWMMPNVYPGVTARRFKIPLVVSPRGTLSDWAFHNGSSTKRLFWPLIQRPALASTVCFHATSEAEYEAVRRRGFHQPVAVIPNGIDVPEDGARPKSRFRTLLYLGRLHPSKGLDQLLSAWGVVQHRFPDWRLTIAGPDSGGYLDDLKREAQRLSLQRLDFIGPVYGRQKWELYRTADLFVLPTYSDNFGMTVAESLAAGTPAIVSKGAPWKHLEEKRAGWWIDMGLDPLVNCLSEVLGYTPDALALMGQCGRAWMQTEFAWKRVGAMMSQTYDWILKGERRPDWIRNG
jgi:glycosyltransferase involved in cell wall biosynthesis